MARPSILQPAAVVPVSPSMKRGKTDEGVTTVDDEAEAAGASLRLIWRDAALMERAHGPDLDVLILLEQRLVKAREKRDKALSALKALLNKQGYERDRVRAHAGEGRTALRDSLVRDARSRLGSLLRELRLASAELVGALHTWRLQLADITQTGGWPVALAEDMLRRADAQVVFPFTISVRVQSRQCAEP